MDENAACPPYSLVGKDRHKELIMNRTSLGRHPREPAQAKTEVRTMMTVCEHYGWKVFFFII